MNYIIFSQSEQFYAGAEKIRLEAFKQNMLCEIIEIKNIANNKTLKNLMDKSSLAYFLTNDPCIPVCVKVLKKMGINIVNEVFLSGNSEKFTLQHKIKEKGIHTPRSVSLSDIKQIDRLDLKYPLYIKSQKQGDVVIYNIDVNELRKNIMPIKNTNEYYLEEAVDSDDLILRKFYYIRGSVVDMNDPNINNLPNWFSIVLKNISSSLGLDVFSADIFINWSNGKYFCIDVNPASSFFKSEKACEEFVKKILIK